MKIKSFKKDKANKYKIIFEDDNEIMLYDDVIVKYNLLVNKEFDDKKYKEIVEYNANLDSYYVALKYINKKMRTKLEIKKYLEKLDFNNKVIKDTINKLVEYKAIDEKLYVKAFINDQINFTNNGPKKIEKKLLDLGISKEDINDYLQTIDKEIWITKISKIIDKKVKLNKNKSYKLLKNKLINSLITDGFYKEDIDYVLGNKDIKIDENIIIKEYEKQKNKLSKKYDGSELDFKIKMKLLSKGYSSEEIDKIKQD